MTLEKALKFLYRNAIFLIGSLQGFIVIGVGVKLNLDGLALNLTTLSMLTVVNSGAWLCLFYWWLSDQMKEGKVI